MTVFAKLGWLMTVMMIVVLVRWLCPGHTVYA